MVTTVICNFKLIYIQKYGAYNMLLLHFFKKIIGILSLIGYLILLIIACVFSALENSSVKLITQYQEIILAFVNGCRAGIISYLICLIILTIIFIIGLIKMNHKLMLPYLFVGIANSISILPVSIALIKIARTFPVENSKIWLIFIQSFFFSIIHIYLIRVVYSYYKEVKNGIYRGVNDPLSVL